MNEGGVDILAGVRAGIGPEVVGQDAVGPAAVLFEGQGGGTGAPLARAEGIIGGGGPEEDGADGQNPAADGLLGGEEEALDNVAGAELVGLAVPR